MLLLMILLLRLLLLLLFLEELLLLCSLATAAPSPRRVVDALRRPELGSAAQSAAAGCRGCPADRGGAVVVGGGVCGGDLGPAHPLDDAAAAVEALLVDGSRVQSGHGTNWRSGHEHFWLAGSERTVGLCSA